MFICLPRESLLSGWLAGVDWSIITALTFRKVINESLLCTRYYNLKNMFDLKVKESQYAALKCQRRGRRLFQNLFMPPHAYVSGLQLRGGLYF